MTGGIEKVCRTLAKALQNLSTQTGKLSFQHFSLYDQSEQIDDQYINEKSYKGFSGSKVVFIIRSVLQGMLSDVIILSHINLLILVPILKFLKPKTKIILFAHGIEIWDPVSNWKREILQNDVEIWAVSRFTAEKIAITHHINKTNIQILNNAIDPFFNWPNTFDKPKYLLDRYGINAEQPILLTLTRLIAEEAYKGYDRVLTALPTLVKKFPNLIYLIAGKADEMEKDRIAQYVKEYNMESNVKLIGFIDEKEKTDFYKLADVFIMPSTMEGFGIVFIEAAACGVKTIGGNQDGSNDALLNGKLGKLVSPENILEIELAIENSLNETKNPLQIQNLCKQHFGFEEYQQKIQHLLKLA